MMYEMMTARIVAARAPRMEKRYVQDDERFSMAISWRMEFSVERPTLSESRIYNQREERVLSSGENAISSKSHS